MRITWLGGPTALMEFGSFRVLTDPMLADGPDAFVMDGHPSTGEDGVVIQRRSPVPAVDLDGLDLLVVSHLHSDHFDQAAVERLPSDVPVLAPPDNIAQLRDWGFQHVEALPWDGRHRVQIGDEVLDLRALPAHHSHNEAVSHDLGAVNGYLIEHQPAAKTPARVYWTGDTIWSRELLLPALAAAHGSDLLLPHLGAVGRGGPWGRMSMDAAEATDMVLALEPAHVVPIHHSTFSHYLEPIEVFSDKLAASTYSGQLHVLSEGDSRCL